MEGIFRCVWQTCEEKGRPVQKEKKSGAACLQRRVKGEPERRENPGQPRCGALQTGRASSDTRARKITQITPKNE